MHSLTTVLSIATTNPFSLAFLEANADAAEVRVLPSGLQYRVLEHGDGHESPVHDTAVEINWEGYTATAFNATPRDAPFYSTYAGDGPMPLTPQEGVSAWEEALQLMTAGDKWEIVAPSQLGYGEEGMEGMVPPGEALVYILEPVKIEGDNAGPRPWDSHAKLLSAKDQRRRTNGGPLRPSSAPMRPERRSGSSNEPWIGWSPDPGKRVLPNPAWAPVDVQGTTQRIRAMRHVERARGRRRQVWHNCVLCGGIHDDGTGCSEPLTISAHWPRVPRGLD